MVAVKIYLELVEVDAIRLLSVTHRLLDFADHTRVHLAASSFFWYWPCTGLEIIPAFPG
jgi:hypothetical protein